MARQRTPLLSLSAYRTVFLAASVLILCVLAENAEKDFDFEDSEVAKVVKRSVGNSILISDDEDLLQGDVGSTSDEEEGSGTTEPPITKTPVLGYPVFFRVTINFTSLLYSPDLGDRNSARFQELSQRLASAIEALFKSTKGQQLVTILQFSPGSVVVTLDIASEGFDNPEVLRSVLEEAIQTGVIGPHRVSREGFTFKSLDEQLECPAYIGREPSRLPRNGTNGANLLVGNPFPCQGNVVGWEYYRLIPEGQAFAGVWRQVGDREFYLVDRTRLPPASAGEHSVLVNIPIRVEQGDFIGIHYPRDVPNNVIAQATLADDFLPANEMYQNYYVEFFDDMVQPRSSFDIGSVPNQQYNATFAIRALMNYDPTEVVPVYTCDSNQFTCSDGYCISASYVCDNQTDCLDSSDERDCVREIEPCLEGRFRCRSTSVCINRRLRCNGNSDCPDGSDEQFCMSCRDDEFSCVSGQCIPRSGRCDGQRNCGDNSDEINCPPSTCSPDQFRCFNGKCISRLQRCDSRRDCPAGDDESNCPKKECSSQEFTCTDGNCISSLMDCDGRPDCPDNSDEDPNRCVPFSGLGCLPRQFQCSDTSCIDGHLQCDGFPDCVDGSDEYGCSTAK